MKPDKLDEMVKVAERMVGSLEAKSAEALRVRCLELACGMNLDLAYTLDAAKDFEAYVTGKPAPTPYQRKRTERLVKGARAKR